MKKNEVSVEVVAAKILFVRGKRVMLDSDLAILYSVETKNLNLQVKRNSRRFPSDFMYQLTRQEVRDLRLQNATSKKGGRRYLLHETDIQVIFKAIKKLLEPPPEPPKPRFGLN
jgi:hypothetical protein